MLKTNITHYGLIIIKSLLEFLPVISFFVAFEYSNENFYRATITMMIMTILYTFYTFSREKRIPYLALFLCLETGIFGSLTLFLHNPTYVQVRDTFYDYILGSVIIITGLLNKPIIKKFFGHIFFLADKEWKELSLKWGTLLLTFGTTNEIVRRNYDELVWVHYKLVIFAITLLFGLYLLWKYRKSVPAVATQI